MRIEYDVNNLYLEEDANISNLGDNAERLFNQQISSWKLAADGYKSLKSVQVKKFEFDGFEIEANFNPGRIISSSAKVDSKSIKERPCFLCVKNLPLEQKAVRTINNFILLVNPFPIFPIHFTVPSINHIPQLIENDIDNMLQITKRMGRNYTLFYNGPKCGASAPDHLHFQIGNMGFMKIDSEYSSVIEKFGKTVKEEGSSKIYSVTGYMRNFFAIESNDSATLNKLFLSVINALKGASKHEEPMINVLCSYENGWRVIIFPRSKHRPDQFFEDGDKKILISPAAVDLGGVCIFPREKDFENISKDQIVDIFQQVTVGGDKMKQFSEEIQKI